jgi:cellulose synthase/poly-beta-1,6-N-acetylglucosamine synthase-like glycosyltransferase
MNASQFQDVNIKNAYIDTVASNINVNPNSIIDFYASRRRQLLSSIRTLLDSVQIGYTVSISTSSTDPSSVYTQLVSNLNTTMSNLTGTTIIFIIVVVIIIIITISIIIIIIITIIIIIIITIIIIIITTIITIIIIIISICKRIIISIT